MTGMNVWKRATLAIVRKPVRSGIIGLLMLMVFTSLVAQVGASTALQKMSDDIGGSLGIGFTVDTGENPVSPKEASRFSRIPGVGKTVYERKTLAQVDGAHPVVPEHGPRLDSGLSTQVDSCFSFQGKFFHFLAINRHREVEHNLSYPASVFPFLREHLNSLDKGFHKLFLFRFCCGMVDFIKCQ